MLRASLSFLTVNSDQLERQNHETARRNDEIGVVDETMSWNAPDSGGMETPWKSCPTREADEVVRAYRFCGYIGLSGLVHALR